MKSLYDFIIKPVGSRYENEIKVGDKTLVLNTKIESFKSVNNLAVVVETPKAFKTSIKKEELNINPGDTIGFTPNSEWDFVVDDQRLFCMKSNDIVIKYEHKRNQIEYNPSWAHRDS